MYVQMSVCLCMYVCMYRYVCVYLATPKRVLRLVSTGFGKQSAFFVCIIMDVFFIFLVPLQRTDCY